MDAVRLVEELTRQGVELSTDGHTVRFKVPVRVLTPELMAQIKTHQVEIMRVLQDEHQGAARALFLEAVAYGGVWSYRRSPDPITEYEIGLAFPDGLDAEKEATIRERAERYKALLLSILAAAKDTDAVIQEACRDA